MCEKHYNQIVAKDYLLNNLKKKEEEDNSNKKLDDTIKNYEILINSINSNITKLMNELLDTRKQLNESELQRIHYIETIKAYEQTINELKNENIKLLLENEQLKKKLNTIFDDQQSRIDSVIQIAQKERRNVYDDITNLISNQERF